MFVTNNSVSAGAFVDDRFKRPGNIQYMSKWLRKSIRPCEGYRESLEGLKAFFKGFEVKFHHVISTGILVCKSVVYKHLLASILNHHIAECFFTMSNS